MEHMDPYDWQLKEWAKLSKHLQNEATRFDLYRLVISSGNGAAKTAFGAMTMIMLMYTQQLRARVTANTDPQMKQIIWPEYDIWFRRARYNNVFFEKFGTSIKARQEDKADSWRIDTFNWSENTPQAISGLHNYGKAVAYVFEEAPGIPASIWQYAMGAFTEKNTIKLWMAFGNSDDPESKFEQNMESAEWNSLRIDTRDLPHVDPKTVELILIDNGGDEDSDDFRVRVRGLPRKTARDSIINKDHVMRAIERGKNFDRKQVEMLPSILMIDPAWTGGDETTIVHRQGQCYTLLEKYKLDKQGGETHRLTYDIACRYEKDFQVDAVFIDQGEGTSIYTLAMQDQKEGWELVAFASSPTDNPDPKLSEYANRRSQMYHETAKVMAGEAVICVRENLPKEEKEKWLDLIVKQLCWTKGSRHKVTQKKTCESKLDIKERVGSSPDIADAFCLGEARKVLERKPEHSGGAGGDRFTTGDQAFKMPDHPVEDMYENMGDGMNYG